MPAAFNEFARRINPGDIPPKTQEPRTGNVPERKKWTFSFQHWRQIDKFGIGQCSNNWFVSLLERLKALSDLTVEDFLSSHTDKESYRFHEIDWGAENIPIRRKDINWLGEVTKNEDFEFVQFHVSKALGRVVGFFDENRVFQVVLFDPMHNIQPSGAFGYRVRATHAGRCELTRAVARFERAISASAKIRPDHKVEIMREMREGYSEITGGSVIFNIDDRDIGRMHALFASGQIDSIGTIISFVLDNLEE